MAHFADETSTGELGRLRGLFKAIVAAKWATGLSTEWYVSLVENLRRWNGMTGEVKSADIWLYASTDSRIRSRVEDRISAASVYIFDPMEQSRDLLAHVSKWFGAPEKPDEVLRILRTGTVSRGFARRLLEHGRRGRITESVIPRVESLLGKAVAGIGWQGTTTPRQLLSRSALASLGEKEFNELVGRFAVALGDCLDPEKHAKAWLTESEGKILVNPGVVAYRQLRDSLPDNMVFDKGYERAFSRLRDAYGTVKSSLEHALVQDRSTYVHNVEMQPSHHYLELQIADVAASGASRVFESSFPPHERACEAVKTSFHRVFFNDRWL